MELGQMIFGQPTEEYEMDEFARSVFLGVLAEWDRVWWNVHQKEFYREDVGDLGVAHFRPYSWSDDDDGPNFWIETDDLCIRWYKHAGRGLTCNKEMTPNDWRDWHNKAVDAIQSVDSARDNL